MQWPLVRRSAFETALSRLSAVKEEADSARAGRDRAQEAAARLKEDNQRLRTAGDDLSLKLTAAEAEIARLKAEPDPMEGLTGDDIRDLLDRFRDGGGCNTCGGIHVRSCPRVKAIRYGRQGDSVYTEEVRYWQDWDATGVIFSDMLPDPDEMQEEDNEPS